MRQVGISFILFGLLLLGGGFSKLFAQPYAPSKSTKILISVYAQQRPQSLILKPQQEVFRVFGGGIQLAELKKDELLYITSAKGKVRIRTIDRALGTFVKVLVKAANDSAVFSLNPANPSSKSPRKYAGRITFAANDAGVVSILETDFEQYIAGVVEAEIGGRQPLEMYKVQAVIARTFALGHMSKHKAESFNLCDDVHCQAYKGISSSNPDIVKGCEQTRDLVVVNRNNELITAVFHANCGGQTVNSEDVWPKYKSYLRSCPCPYCSNSRSYRWRMGVPLSKWDKYLTDNGVAAPPDLLSKDFRQEKRKSIVELGNVAFPLYKVRKDFGLRSAFFSFTQVGDSIIFSGKGYGHGVGLCQDGASNMARMHMSYQHIISYYYKGCKIINRQNAVPETSDDKATGDDGAGMVATLAPPASCKVQADADSSANSP
ncbi:SpoIID/LytB domain-containing protein [uncultured Acetobacteroides sp.]|uniref:SpoIID/LytB domain-containing protein n=1 Tax=uncultured Acetobacteroides sp. TaxID=1760811 RepID=UPI0029F59681|nr:SpoIID/LytB domain-containing protein [uncultured Acetobacteroides sp.]